MRACLVLFAVGCAPAVGVDEPLSFFATEVLAFEPGEKSGFGDERMPDVVLGPPRGSGEGAGSFDVVSLGVGGSLTLGFERAIVDVEGPDFIVFENAFIAFGGQLRFSEPCLVEVADLEGDFVAFDCAPDDEPPNGCAGMSAVYANVDENNLPATDPDIAGGDTFDLAELADAPGEVRRIRITDLSTDGDAPTAGCDVDAIAIVR